MIDIHCHILPGIDDGARNAKESLRMAKIAAADGVKKIVATPHVKETIHSAEFLRECVARLNELLMKKKVPVEILYGADSYALLPPEDLKQYTINNTQYVLLEFPYTHIPHNAGEILCNLALQGLRPIITHPERIPTVMDDPETLLMLLKEGVYVQVTADSLVGNFGSRIQDCTIYLLQQGVVHFIASDAHSAKVRKPVLSSAVDLAEKIIGKENARKLVEDNPQAVISGKDIPW